MYITFSLQAIKAGISLYETDMRTNNEKTARDKSQLYAHQIHTNNVFCFFIWVALCLCKLNQRCFTDGNHVIYIKRTKTKLCTYTQKAIFETKDITTQINPRTVLLFNFRIANHVILQTQGL